MLVPHVIQDCLSGEPEVGLVDAAFEFLTVDPEGFPHVCLLSRAQLEADERSVRVVIAGSQTKANLDRVGRACLVIVSDNEAHYCKLVVAGRVGNDPLIGYSLGLHHHKVDSLPGSALSGMTYRVIDTMPRLEDWVQTRRLLASLGR